MKPAVLDQITEEIADAAACELLQVVCSFKWCPHAAVQLVHISKSDGGHRLFGLCREHLIVVRAHLAIGRAVRQGFFIY